MTLVVSAKNQIPHSLNVEKGVSHPRHFHTVKVFVVAKTLACSVFRNIG